MVEELYNMLKDLTEEERTELFKRHEIRPGIFRSKFELSVDSVITLKRCLKNDKKLDRNKLKNKLKNTKEKLK